MKVTKTQIKQIIKEELEAVLSEDDLNEFFGPFKKKKKLKSSERKALMGEYPYEPNVEANPKFNPRDPRLSPEQQLKATMNKRKWDNDEYENQQDYERRKARKAREAERELTPAELARQKEKRDKEQASYRDYVNRDSDRGKERRRRFGQPRGGVQTGRSTPGYISDKDRDDDRFDQ